MLATAHCAGIKLYGGDSWRETWELIFLILILKLNIHIMI